MELTEKTATQESPFDVLRLTREDGSEYWSARDLQGHLGYAKWERFNEAIERAQQAARNMGGERVEEHFPGAGKVIEHGKGSMQLAKDYHLSRYAAYLVAMNGDSRKPEIAAAQHYFAVRTREAELGAKPKETDYLSLEPAQLRRMASILLRKAELIQEIEERRDELAKIDGGTYKVRMSPTPTPRRYSSSTERMEPKVTAWVQEFVLPDATGCSMTTTKAVLEGVGVMASRASEVAVGRVLHGMGFERVRIREDGVRRYFYKREKTVA